MSQASDTMRREWKINDAKRDASAVMMIWYMDRILCGTNWMFTDRRIWKGNFR